MREALGDGSNFGGRFTYIMQEKPLGLAHVVKISEGFIRKEPFVFYLGDNVVVGGISGFVDEFKAKGPPASSSSQRPNILSGSAWPRLRVGGW